MMTFQILKIYKHISTINNNVDRNDIMTIE